MSTDSEQRTSAGSAPANGAMLIASPIGTATAGDVQTIGNLPSEGADERVQNTNTAIEAADLSGHDLDLGPVPTSVVLNLPPSPPHSSSYTAVVNSHSASVVATVHAGGINGAGTAEPAVENIDPGIHKSELSLAAANTNLSSNVDGGVLAVSHADHTGGAIAHQFDLFDRRGVAADQTVGISAEINPHQA